MVQQRHQEQDVPRETFITLRARREAYHVASDLLYRDIATDPPPPPPLPPLPAELIDRFSPWISGGSIVLVSFIALSVVVIVLLAMAQGLIQFPTRLR